MRGLALQVKLVEEIKPQPQPVPTDKPVETKVEEGVKHE